jgi:Zn-dependent protease
VDLINLLRSDPLAFLLLAIALVWAISLHEFAHAWAADRQGDRMPRAMGRVTLNPARHLDPLGTIALFLVGFGWGKPVEFRTSALSSRRFGAAIVALAGPAMNLLLAFLGAVAFELYYDGSMSSGLDETALVFLNYFIGINVILAVFNLMPLPPLDGSRLLTIFLPPSKQKIIFFLDQYGFVILLALVFLTGFAFLSPIIDNVAGVILDIAGAVVP